MQALERRLLIAESTLEVSPEEDVQMADIQEEDDASVLSQGGSGMGVAQRPGSNAVQIGARRSAAMQSQDVSSAAAAVGQTTRWQGSAHKCRSTGCRPRASSSGVWTG